MLADAKSLVSAYYRDLDAAPPAEVPAVMSHHLAPDYRWRGSHPFNEVNGAEEVGEAFWVPLKEALAPLQRRQDIFFAGLDRLDGQTSLWVCSMGHILGFFRQPWLTLRPTGKLAFLRYCEFHRIEDGHIAEAALHLDVMSMLVQAGSSAVPEATGTVTMTPGPQTHDGLVNTDRPPEEGEKTLDLIERMINRLIATDVKTTVEDLKKDWATDMLWWGPAGVGASYTFDGYLRGHTKPFEDGLEYIRHNGHVVRIAEGNFGGFFGYPSLTMRPKGGYMGLTSKSEATADMRIVDLYRRDGELLAENWIFIDHLWFLKQLGVDLLERHNSYARR